jgi:O-antigen/teichoic acid export membrane protein
MKSLRRVLGNSVISLLGQLVTWSSTLLLTIAYGRFLGDLRFGELYFAITFVALIGFPIEFGFNQQLTRDVAQEPDKAIRYLVNTLFLKVVLWGVLYSLILYLALRLGYDAEQRALITICGLTLLCTAITNSFAALHYAFERTIFPVAGTVIEKGADALIGVVLLRQGADVEVMALVLLFSALANTLWQGAWFVRLVGIKPALDGKLMLQLSRTGLPFLIYGVLGVIYYRLDTVLLSLMTNAQVVGWYGAGYRIFDTLIFLPSLIISTVMYPVFSKLSITSEATLKLAVEKSLNFLLVCAAPIATVLVVGASSVIGFFYHRPEFSHSIRVLEALGPGLFFLYINTVFTTILISIKQEKKITVMAAVALVFNLGMNLLLIPLYKQVGSAMVTTLTELLLLCIAIPLTPRRLLPTGSIPVAAKAGIAAVAMTLVIRLMKTLSLIYMLPVAMLVYLLLATLLGVIPREDIQSIVSAVRKKSQPATEPVEPALAEIEPALAAGEPAFAENEPAPAGDSPWFVSALPVERDSRTLAHPPQEPATPEPAPSAPINNSQRPPQGSRQGARAAEAPIPE